MRLVHNVKLMDNKDNEALVNDKIFDDIEDLFQIYSLDNDVVYACNVRNDGFDIEEDVIKHLTCIHKEVLQHIHKE